MQLTRKPTAFVGNLMAYGASEVASKVSRLFVVMAVARSLDLTQIGIAASAIAAGDILKSLTENGVGQRIIAARDEELQATCATAHRIFWVWCSGLFGLQSLIALGFLLSGGSEILAVLILLLGAEYLFMPAGLVQVALAMRAGQLKRTASIAGAQIVGANLMSVLLVLVWPSALAVVLPRLLSAPIWLMAVRRLHPWRRDPQAGYAPLRPFVSFGWAVLGVELVKALRLQSDKLIVGALMGPQALGLYFMAFNAGLSLSNSFTTAFSTVLFPHLTQTADRTAALRGSMLIGVGLIAPVVILQALAAPYYVPVMFGDGWDDIADIVAILCLVAIPTTLWTAAAGWLRANNRPQVELLVTVALTMGVVANTVILAPHGLAAVATGYAVTTTTLFCAASLPAIRAAFFSHPLKV
ncbi:polysaccharide transporter, PST family [Loktanella sp. DSM 29012]|uniref:oligosaccharide flippase family protein n=1 Tax=Loktanella sp. DSM 29012 TaxID=1881056 RepID=UPI0008CD858A|nr:oligosaccharide flippase family protein [Loktanella sp. DSM 29012]SEQ03297.1 polysaccharide transporter, PST family [Loktanella sp. DSM 29012]